MWQSQEHAGGAVPERTPTWICLLQGQGTWCVQHILLKATLKGGAEYLAGDAGSMSSLYEKRKGACPTSDEARSLPRIENRGARPAPQILHPGGGATTEPVHLIHGRYQRCSTFPVFPFSSFFLCLRKSQAQGNYYLCHFIHPLTSPLKAVQQERQDSKNTRRPSGKYTGKLHADGACLQFQLPCWIAKLAAPQNYAK